MNERELTKDEMSDKEKYVKGMKKAKKDFKKRYGDDAESVMYATATKMAKEGLNETEENSVSDKKENVQAEERQEDLNWLEDIKRLSGLDNTYENSVDAMKEYKVDESADTEQEVIAESTEEQVDEVMPFVKMTYKEIQDNIKRIRLEIEDGEREDVAMIKPRLRDLLDMKDVVKVILNNKGWGTEYIVGAMMDSGLDTSVREELAEKFKKQVSKDPQLAKKLFKDPQVEEASGEKMSEPTQDAFQELKDYAETSGGIDKEEFEKAAYLVKAMGKPHLKDKAEGMLDDLIGKMDSDPRDKVIQVLARHIDLTFLKNLLDEAEYQGRKVKLGKPTRGDVKKFKVYVKNPKGNVVKVNFGHGGTSAKKAGQKTMKIKKSNPARRKSFRARHNCDNPGPRHKARYWSCRAW